jgi:hypothetical protein
MITMRDFMEVINYRITEGSEYGWQCYGPNAHSLDSWNGDNDEGYSAGIVFDTVTQVVYELDVCDYKNNRAYRWIHPEFREEYVKHSECNDTPMDQAWDDVCYTDLDVREDILSKAEAIVKGLDYDTRVSVPLELEDDVILAAALEAHKMDITLNDYIQRVLAYHAEEVSNKRNT